jgi:hypothetical protein
MQFIHVYLGPKLDHVSQVHCLVGVPDEERVCHERR